MRKYRTSTPESRRQHWFNFIEEVTKAHAPLDKTMKAHFSGHHVDMPAVKDLRDQLEGQENKQAWVNSHLTDIRETVTFDLEKMARSLRPGLQTIVKTAGQSRLDDLYKEGYIDKRMKFNPRPLNDLVDTREELVLDSISTTLGRVANVIKENLVADTIENIKSDMAESMFAQKETIGTTEATALNNAADLEAVIQSGVPLLKVWVSVQDSAVRDTHTDAEDKYAKGIPLDEDFEVGDDSMPAPGGGSEPGENCGCRCSIDYIEDPDVNYDLPQPEEE